MKFFLALAFLTMVCAIPRPGRISTTSETLEPSASIQGSGQGYSPVEDAKGELLLSELESSDESDYIAEYNDEEDISESISLEDLIIALHRIRNAIQKKIHSKLSHYKDSGDGIYVTSERVPVDEDSANETAAESPQQGNRKKRELPGYADYPQNNSALSNNTKGNDTASDYNPKINITQIKKEIHDKINDIIENVFRPWLGNKTLNPLQQDNKTVVDTGSISNRSRLSAGNSSKPEDRNTAIDAPQPGNHPELEPPNETEGSDTFNDLVEVNSNRNNGNKKVIDVEISNIVPRVHSQLSVGSEVPHNVQTSDESQVRFVNPIGLITREGVQQPSSSFRNFPYHIAHYH
ncbi:uncharacterized protein LOC123875967 isoform X1 [Maniola jurtina]|uniref:uncharacterized protein LOC123875967 isoform X1 n=1 Tax=Maniola jurtina TaxID=191418 RepID=UPI001E68E426|nr:uncharacterized protein LOC123875967 isoform X1 [Maniola jurtina]